MMLSIYDKTDKGREEIATRKYGLANRLRTMLVMVDGRQDTATLLAKVAGLGLNEDSMRALLDDDYIALVASAAPQPEPEPEVKARPEPEPAATPGAARQPQAAAYSATQYQALCDFYNQGIKSALGLRGYRLQLKVEKAASVDDFRALRQPFLDAVRKTRGEELATSLARQLDQLLQT